MLLAERAGRKLEPWSNSRPRGMAVIACQVRLARRNRIRPIGLLHFSPSMTAHDKAGRLPVENPIAA
jgi:hypothetical protein